MGLASLLLGEQNPFAQWTGQNSNLLGALGAGLASGPDFSSGIAQGLQMAPQAKAMDYQMAEKKKADALTAEQVNQTKQWLEANYPQYAHLPPEQGFKLAMEAEAAKYKGGADAESFFGNPVPYQGPDGQIQFGQIGNRGTFKPIDLGDKGKFVSPTKTVNTETEQIVMDQFGNVLSRMPIQNQQAAHDTAVGKGMGEAQVAQTVAAPKDIAAGEVALDVVNQIRNHPALQSATGFTAPLNNILVGTDRFGFQQLVDQAKSGAFLTAIQQMRGMGALSNAEGQTATAAVTRMNTAMSKDDFLKALSDYEAIVRGAMERAAGALAGGATGAGVLGVGGGNRTSTGVTWSVEP